MDISVIIGTLATKQRHASLARALDSLRAQSIGRAVPIVVVNGQRRDAEVVSFLRSCPDVHLIEIAEGSLSKALAAGRKLVATEYFGVLDDDDEYLPNAFAIRLQAFTEDHVDVAVTNGYILRESGEEEALPEIASYADDPLAALARANWLASCGALYRTDSVSLAMISEMPAYLEWTYFAYRLALQKKIRFCPEPTYRIYANSAGSLSSSNKYFVEGPEAIKKIRALELPPTARRQVEEKYARALHEASMRLLMQGDHLSAWKFHLRSMASRYGLRYLFYTRHILRASAGSVLGWH